MQVVCNLLLLGSSPFLLHSCSPGWEPRASLCAKQNTMALWQRISFSSSFFKKNHLTNSPRGFGECWELSERNRNRDQAGTKLPGSTASASRASSASLISGIPSWSLSASLFSYFCNPILKLFCFLQSWGALSEILQHQTMETEFRGAPYHSLCVPSQHTERRSWGWQPSAHSLFPTRPGPFSAFPLLSKDLSICSPSCAGTL